MSGARNGRGVCSQDVSITRMESKMIFIFDGNVLALMYSILKELEELT